MSWFSEFASAALPWIVMAVAIAVVMTFAPGGKVKNEKKEGNENGKE